jgi:hypothetical protein
MNGTGCAVQGEDGVGHGLQLSQPSAADPLPAVEPERSPWR